MNDFDSLTTRGGDNGETGLPGGMRRPKDNPVFEVLGDFDELSAAIGIARAALMHSKSQQALLGLQKKLLVCSAMIAGYPEHPPKNTLGEKDLLELENSEKELLKHIPAGNGFIFPGDSLPGAHIHLARTICRRLERKLAGLIRNRKTAGLTLLQKYINRMSDYLFVMACFITEKEKK